MSKKPTADDLLIREAFSLIGANAKKIEALTEESRNVLDSVRELLVGREIEGNYVAASLKGKYEIRYVELNYDATEINASGLKVLTGRDSGRRGNQCRDLGRLSLRRLSIPEARP